MCFLINHFLYFSNCFRALDIMGQCLACKCDTDDSVLSTPFGSVAIKHCGLSSNCFGKKEDDAAMRQINIAIRAELVLIEHEMRQQMLSHLKEHGTVMPVQVGGSGTPPSLGRQLSVRIETTPPNEISCQNTTASKPDISIHQI